MTSLYAGKGFYINADSIEIVQEWNSRVAEREKRRAVECEQFYDACRGKPIRCLITLKSGWVIACPNTPEALISRPLVHPPVRVSARRARDAERDPERDPEEPGNLRDWLDTSANSCTSQEGASRRRRRPPSP